MNDPVRATAGSGFESTGEDRIRAVGITTAFAGRTVLDGVDLTVRAGEIFVIMGPSGCGKTTMLRHLCGLSRPSIGSVYLDDKDVYALPERELEQLRLKLGLSFQGGALLGSLSVADNVALPIRENAGGLPPGLIDDIVRMKLDMVGLLHAAQLMPSDLSGGMLKRAAIARAIALDPDILFFDEPSAGLDPVTAAEVDNLICKLNQVFGITMVVVTHDLPSAYAIADRIAVFFDGHVAALGEKEDVWNTSQPRIRDFIDRRMQASRGNARSHDLLEFLTI